MFYRTRDDYFQIPADKRQQNQLTACNILVKEGMQTEETEDPAAPYKNEQYEISLELVGVSDAKTFYIKKLGGKWQVGNVVNEIRMHAQDSYLKDVTKSYTEETSWNMKTVYTAESTSGDES